MPDRQIRMFDDRAQALRAIAEDHVSGGDAGEMRRVKRAKNQRPPQHRLQELRFCRTVVETIAVAGRQHERVLDGAGGSALI